MAIKAIKKIRHLLTVGDMSPTEIQAILKKSVQLKKIRSQKRGRGVLHDRIIGLLFQKPSTRTRVSFEVGVRELGGSSIFLDEGSLQTKRGESLDDTLRVLERYVSGMVIRNHDHGALARVAPHLRIPLINGLSEQHHPTQALADAMTVMERVKKTPRLAYLGEGNNVTVSLIEVCSALKWPLTVAAPRGYGCDPETLKNSVWDDRYISFTEDPEKAVRGVDVVYTDTWFSMTGGGEEKKDQIDQKALAPYQINARLLRDLPDCIFLHCLPAYRGNEVTAEIMDGPRSAVWDQAENRLHIQKGLMTFFFSKKNKI